MNKLKQAFAELRKNTPIHVQWLFLFAAFLVVVILLLLLLSGPRKTATEGRSMTEAALTLSPAKIEWRNVPVGEMRSQIITVTPVTDTIVSNIIIPGEDAIGGLSRKTTCINMRVFSERNPCTITLDWTPDAALETTDLEVQIIYHGANVPADMVDKKALSVTLSAVGGAAPLPPVAPPVDPFLDTSDDVDIDEFDGTTEEDTGWDWDWGDDNSDWGGGFETLVPTPGDTIEIMPPLPADNCLEFAFPGFNLSGRQSGWIRPIGGRFLFHPFGDTECQNPTGEYDMATGLIYDLKNPSRSIGSDADRIGGRAFGVRGTELPQLGRTRPGREVVRARQLTPEEVMRRPPVGSAGAPRGASHQPGLRPARRTRNFESPSIINKHATISSGTTDRTFILRQYKPIPATIVSEVRADARTIGTSARLPVTATVDRHVYSDNGRTIILPAGTQMLGYVHGELPGPYRAIGRMQIDWYRFVRPDGVEFNFMDHNRRPFSADSQGRVGVPGRGSTDYIESMIMPMMTALVPAAVNMIAPISDRFVNQIDLDNNTVTQSGQVRSSELAKQEIISTWNKVVQRLVLDMMDNTTPPFSIAAGTRITVFSPTDLVVTCGDPNDDDRNCAMVAPSWEYADVLPHEREGMVVMTGNVAELMGQVRSLGVTMAGVCEEVNDPGAPGGRRRTGVVQASAQELASRGIDFRTAEFYCRSTQFQAINNARWDAFFQHQQGAAQTAAQQPGGMQQWQQQHLGLQFNDQGQMLNPFSPPPPPPAMPAAPAGLLCEDHTVPDADGCCTGETLTDMADQGWNCCPDIGGDCFPPLQ